MTEEVQEQILDQVEEVSEVVETTEDKAPETILDTAEVKTEEVVAEVKTEFDFKNYIESSEFKEEKSLSAIKDMDGLVKSYVNAQKMVGKKIEDMSPEEADKLYSRLRPESTDEYLKDVELDEFSKKLDTSWYSETAHELGLTKKQHNALLAKFAENQSNVINVSKEEASKVHEAKVEEVKAMFGEDFKEGISASRNAIIKLGGEELFETIRNSGLGSDPKLIKAFYEASKFIKEDGYVEGNSSPETAIDTEQKRQSAIQKFRGENRDALLDIRHQGHKEAVEKLHRLYKL